jgi:hypothetical protein
MNTRALAALSAGALVSACFLGGGPGASTTSDDAGADSAVAPLPFQADSPSVYVPKVKNLLTGLAASKDEISKVAGAADPKGELAKLIDQWMTLPQYTDTMLGFFELAFQQAQIGVYDFDQIIPSGPNGTRPFYTQGTMVPLIANMKESFARTMLEIVKEGRPLTDAFTTTSFMMTPPLMELYAFMDANRPNDLEKVADQFDQQYPTTPIVIEDTTPIPLSVSIDPSPTNPNFMHWYFKGLSAIDAGSTCADRRVYTHDKVYPNTPGAWVIHTLLYGTLPNMSGNNACGIHQVATNSYFTDADFASWKMIDVRKPGASEKTTRFYDLPTIRTSNELVLDTPRVDFFSTPAFHANWQTNTGNQMRVTINQLFIVAFGLQVDGTEPPTDVGTSPPGIGDHADPNSTCFGCHKTLDPSRSILQATFSYGYGPQTDPALTSVPGWFAFAGILNQNISSIADLGATLGSKQAQPLVAKGWVQKLCYFATSEACAEDDPVFLKAVDDFMNGGFKWNDLVRELLSSDTVTYAARTQTASEEGQLVTITRRNQLCRLLDERLSLNDVCGLAVISPPNTQSMNPLAPPAQLAGVPLLASALAADGYGRGMIAPVVASQPSLFYRTALENLCEDVATLLIDSTSTPAGAHAYSSTDDVNETIADFVTRLMGVQDDDPRFAQINSILQTHYQNAQTSGGLKASDALKSTFVAACLSPSVAAIGM